jgi:hypothetical protein
LASTLQPSATVQVEVTEEGTKNAKLSEIEGDVQVRQSNEPSFVTATNDYELMPNGEIKTLDLGKVRMDLPDKSIVRLGPNSFFTYIGAKTEQKELITQLKLEAGKLWVILKGDSLEVDTPSGVASVRGSQMSVTVDPKTNTVYITCLEGECTLKNGVGSVTLVAGQTALITNTFTPPTIGNMTDDEVSEWLLENPEATAVIPHLTQTAKAVLSRTPTPKAGPTTVHSGTIPQAPK